MTEQGDRTAPGWSPLHRRLAARLLRANHLSPDGAPESAHAAEAAQVGPLTFAQERIWFLQELEGTDASYRSTSAARLHGPLRSAALGQAMDSLRRRHPGLRATIEIGPSDGEASTPGPRQRVNEAGAEGVNVVDLSDLEPSCRETMARQLLDEERAHPFDAMRRPPLRVHLLRTSAQSHLFAMSVHHLVADQWSLRIVEREVGSHYAVYAGGEPLISAPPALSPVAVAARERAAFSWPRFERRVQNLAERFAGAATELAIAEKGEREPRSISHAETFAIPDGAARAVARGAARFGVTEFMYMLAAFELLLFRYTGQRRFLIGCPVSNRTQPGTEDVIGCLFNTLIFEASFSGDPTLGELLERVKADSIDNFAHQDLPFEKLVEKIRPHRSTRHSPLFDAMFMWAGKGPASLQLPGLDVQPVDVPPPPSRFALTWSVGSTPFGKVVQVGYASDRLAPPLVGRMFAHYVAILEALTGDAGRRASELPLLVDHERHLLLAEWNDAKAPVRSQLLHDVVEKRALEDPDRIAVVQGDLQLTYAVLVRRARRLAARLRAHGVENESIVGVCLPRSAHLAVALLGVLEAGAAYLPLDRAWPIARLETMLRRARATTLICDPELGRIAEEQLGVRAIGPDMTTDAAAPEGPSAPPIDPARLAYVIFTSGSTGIPKGVGVLHHSVTHLLDAMVEKLPLGRSDSLVSVTSVSFDIAALELFLPWKLGGRVVIADEEQTRDGEALGTLLREVGASAMQATPMTWRLLAAARPESIEGLVALSGGEVLPRPLADVLLANTAQLWNLYGPTETTIWSTAARVTPGKVAPALGRPLTHWSAHVLDGALALAPIGVEGELFLGGVGVARGYLGDAGQTAARFVPDTFSAAPGARMYRTGDRAYRRSDGQLAFIGRRDNQIKRRGYRIELEEIERALAAAPGVGACAVIALPEQDGDRPIVACYVRGHDDVTPATLRSSLLERLPDYMVPSAFVEVNALPRNTSGKIDRRALAASLPRWEPAERLPAPPANPTEARLAHLWAEALGRDAVGVEDDFFAIGGHSLLALRLVTRIRQELAGEITVRDLFTARTVRGLAPLLATPASEARTAGAVSPAADDHALSRAQLRLWIQEQSGQYEASYNTLGAFRVRGELDRAAFLSAIDQLVARHDSLRTRFDSTGYEPRRCVLPDASVPVRWCDLRNVEGAARRADELLLADARRSFDISKAPLLRVTCVRLDDEQTIVTFAVHHIVSDGWSIAILMREFGTLYVDSLAGRPDTLGVPPPSYGAYVAHERAWLAGPEAPLAEQAWLATLAAPRPVLDLAGDHPRPTKAAPPGAAAFFDCGPALTSALETWGTRRGVTLFMTVLAAVRVLLHQRTGQRETIIGSPFAGRLDPRFQRQVGLHVNTIALRNTVADGATFDDLVSSERNVVLRAFEHQAYPFDLLLAKLEVRFDRRRFPLFGVWVEMQNYAEPGALPSLPRAEATPYFPPPAFCMFDLEFTFFRLPGGLSFRIRYKRDFHERSTIESIGNGLKAILARAVAGASAADSPAGSPDEATR